MSVEQWCAQELGILLGEEAPDDFITYLIAIEDEEELHNYVEDLLGENGAQTDAFIEKLQSKRSQAPDGMKVHIKHEESGALFDDVLQSVRPKQKNQAKKAQSKKVDLARLHKYTQMQGEPPIPAELPLQNGSTSAPSKVIPKKTKTKYVSIYSAEGEARSTIQLSGRHCCECQAQKHKLISNCLSCGRVVCAQEGSGPCLFCGELVCTKGEADILASNTKASLKLRKKLTDTKNVHPEKIGYQQQENVMPDVHDEDLNRAIKHKNRLLENDRNSLSRMVIDDQSDYFSMDANNWLSTKDRRILQERKDLLKEHKYGSRRNKKLTLDFAGRRVIEENDQTNMYNINDDAVQSVHFGKTRKDDDRVENKPKEGLINPNIQQPAPQFNLKVENKFKVKRSEISDSRSRGNVRIQDRELLEMSDEGWCLSMHQPWASLLIEGIKRHEGRTWYSTHRGRLWIAAAAKKPTEEEINVVENSHRQIVGNEDVAFPSQYPTGCLLGCVDMVDCLSQEQYREKFPDGESSSEYVFIVENPQELILRFPIKGRHKLWKVDSQIHKAAKKGLRPPKRS